MSFPLDFDFLAYARLCWVCDANPLDETVLRPQTGCVHTAQLIYAFAFYCSLKNWWPQQESNLHTPAYLAGALVRYKLTSLPLSYGAKLVIPKKRTAYLLTHWVKGVVNNATDICNNVFTHNNQYTTICWNFSPASSALVSLHTHCV